MYNMSKVKLSQSQRFPLGLAQGLARALPLALGFGGALGAALCRLAAGCSSGASSSELSATSGCGTGAFPAACRLAAVVAIAPQESAVGEPQMQIAGTAAYAPHGLSRALMAGV